MARKKFIRDEWKLKEDKSLENYDETLPVRKCTENIAQMNILEYIYFDFRYWYRHGIWFDIIKDGIIDFMRGLLTILTIPLAPVGLIFIAHSDIKRCKKEMEIFERTKNEKN